MITVENLSKAYQLGLKDEIPDTLVGALKKILHAPLRNLRQLTKLDTSRLDHGQRQRDSDEILWALNDVSFNVAVGDVVGIIGKNGAGKSTLLKILSRITQPTAGQARIQGRVSSLLEVGTGFHPELTGRENVYMNGTILGMTKHEIDRKFDEIVEFSGVEKFLDTPTKRYSSGMQVRLAFAVAAHLEPEVLVVDEVLAVGDMSFQKKCINKMQAISGEGRTVLFVSHNMSAIENLCNRVIGLENHRVAIDTDTRSGLEWYLNTNKSTSKSFTSQQRKGSGTTRVEDIKVSSSCGRTFLQMGDAIKFTVMFETTHREPIDVGIAFNDKFGTRLFRLNMSDMNVPPISLTESRTLTCETESLNLLPGHYTIAIGVSSEHGELLDYIPEALDIEILPAPVFPSGRVPAAANASMFSLSKWSSVSTLPVETTPDA